MATDELLPLVYEELRILAAQELSHEPLGQTLQATALVRVIELADKKYLDRLFTVLILEVVGIAVGVFAGFVQLPATVEREVEAVGARTPAARIPPDVETITANRGRNPEDPAAVAAAGIERILDDVLTVEDDRGN